VPELRRAYEGVWQRIPLRAVREIIIFFAVSDASPYFAQQRGTVFRRSNEFTFQRMTAT
jgi:hypothetical protein